jgi:hypothetical protein
VTGVTLFLVAGPWIGLLSWHYRTFTFSTTRPIAHALVGQNESAPSTGPARQSEQSQGVTDKGHPTFSSFQEPEAGRLTSWEEPTGLPYHYWSPFASRKTAMRQLQVISQNARAIGGYLTGFDFLRLGLAFTLAGLLFHVPWRANLGATRWRWAAMVIVCLCLPYVPLLADTERYFRAVYPFLLAGSLGLVGSLTLQPGGSGKVTSVLSTLLVCLSFWISGAHTLLSLLAERSRPVTSAWVTLGDKLRNTGHAGTVAGNHRSALYVSWRMDQPFYGTNPEATASDFRKSRARLVIVERDSPVVAELDRDSFFKNLDSTLFAEPDEAAQFYYKVYEVPRIDPADIR